MISTNPENARLFPKVNVDTVENELATQKGQKEELKWVVVTQQAEALATQKTC